MMNREKIYICDPKKNEKCKKTACQTLCFCTLNEECKATGIEWLKHKIAEKKAGE